MNHMMETDQFDSESSSLLKRAEYNPLLHHLYIWFKNTGAKYTYKGVPEETWEEFKNSESKGKYFHVFIKPLYKFEKEST